jgi:hypothetical protein
MIYFAFLDANGYVISTGASTVMQDGAVELDEPPQIPLLGAGQKYHLATKTVVDTRTLADFKSAQWATIKQARELAEFGGFVWDGSLFDSDAISQQRIQGLVHIANLDPSMTVGWTLADNTTRTLTSADGIAVGIALAAHVNTQHVKARALREQIDAATTPEAVQAITWES